MKSVDKYDKYGTQLNSNEFNCLSKTLHERNHQNILLLMISAGIVFLVLVRSRKSLTEEWYRPLHRQSTVDQAAGEIAEKSVHGHRTFWASQMLVKHCLARVKNDELH